MLDFGGFFGVVHQTQNLVGFAFRIHFAQHVGGFVRIHFFEDVGGALLVETFHDVGGDLVFHFFERIRDGLIVETVDHFASFARTHLLHHPREIGRVQMRQFVGRDFQLDFAAGFGLHHFHFVPGNGLARRRDAEFFHQRHDALFKTDASQQAAKRNIDAGGAQSILPAFVFCDQKNIVDAHQAIVCEYR